ncbi:MAG: hypothetical protein ACO3N7_03430 [Kiritimatiellia bacterium]
MRVFLLTSYPSLSFEGPNPTGFDSFIRDCSNHLSPADFAELDAVCATPPEGKSAFARDWAEVLKKSNAHNSSERAQRLGLADSPQKPFIENNPLRGGLESAWNAPHPLQREKILLRTLWDWIGERRRSRPFSLEDLMGYALQLRILERMQLWSESEGQIQFQEHTQSFLEPVLEELRKQELSA